MKMAFYVTYSKENGLGRYDSNVHQRIPAGAIEVSAALFVKTIQEADGVWIIDAEGNLTKEPLAVVVPDYKEAIASERYRREIGGISVSGMLIDTSDRSKTLINGSALKALRNAEYVLSWKTADGFIDLQASQVLAIADAVSEYVQACFNREKDLLLALDAGSFVESMLTEGWP